MTEPSLIIRPASFRVDLRQDVAELWKYRRLIKALVFRDIRVRYRNSSFGLIWSLLTPLLQVMVTTVAFGYFLGAGPHNLSEFIMCALLPWTYFQTVLLDASAIVNNYQGIMKKAYFPREVPVIAACCSNAIQLFASLIIFIIYRWGIVSLLHGWVGWPPVQLLWFPVLLVLTFLLTLGVSLLVTAYSFFYEDVRVVLVNVLAALYFLTPINYFAENILHSGRIHSMGLQRLFYNIYLADPLAWLITAYKQVFFRIVVISPPNASSVYFSSAFSLKYLALSTVTI
jgi:ABC-type polysaccharide/polyol phosphate export permease